MRLFLAVAICKILYNIGSRLGKGSSLPGRVALTVYPGVLKRVGMPKNLIAVTGSNGKTSTAEMLARALEANGVSVGWNHEGANQIEGIATLVLRTATFRGEVKRDALVLECDERYTRRIFENIRPSVVVVTNLCRDQLTRNGHHEFIQGCIRAAIDAAGDKLRLVLNADDPYVAALAAPQMHNPGSGAPGCCFFGISNPTHDGTYSQRYAGGMYDDGAFCPVCKGRMQYDYYTAAHMGGYHCGDCGFSRPNPGFEVAGMDSETGEIAFGDGIKTKLAFPGLTGMYNLIAAVAAASEAGVRTGDAARALEGYELTGGRTVRFSLDDRDGILLVSKHENSLSYNQSLAYIVGRGKPCTVVIMVDSISRKYYTSETSWLWDIDFGILADESVKNIVLAGRYVNELAARFAMTEVSQGIIGCVGDRAGLRDHIERGTTGDVFLLTCFSDIPMRAASSFCCMPRCSNCSRMVSPGGTAMIVLFW